MVGGEERVITSPLPCTADFSPCFQKRELKIAVPASQVSR